MIGSNPVNSTDGTSFGSPEVAVLAAPKGRDGGGGSVSG